MARRPPVPDPALAGRPSRRTRRDRDHRRRRDRGRVSTALLRLARRGAGLRDDARGRRLEALAFGSGTGLLRSASPARSTGPGARSPARGSCRTTARPGSTTSISHTCGYRDERGRSSDHRRKLVHDARHGRRARPPLGFARVVRDRRLPRARSGSPRRRRATPATSPSAPSSRSSSSTRAKRLEPAKPSTSRRGAVKSPSLTSTAASTSTRRSHNAWPRCLEPLGRRAACTPSSLQRDGRRALRADRDRRATAGRARVTRSRPFATPGRQL